MVQVDFNSTQVNSMKRCGTKRSYRDGNVQKYAFAGLLLGALILLGTGLASAAVTKEQRAKLDELDEATKVAGKLYSERKYVDCAQQISQVQRELLELLQVKDPALLRLAKPIYARLGRAHGLLELEGAELEALPTWSELSSRSSMPKDTKTEPVSFRRDLAPWLASACGGCHIDRQRGRYSMKTFVELRQSESGTLIRAGSSGDSRLVEIIESGDMPRGGGTVSDEQLRQLKLWIDQGAKFDGPNPAVPLRSIIASPPRRPATSPLSTASKAGEVSFSNDIAPVLMENCNGCHIGGQRASGGLRLDTFARLLRGGDSGEILAGNNPNQSLLIQKLKGEQGQRMPLGRPPLSDEQIGMISDWIRQGASFDGPSQDSNIEVVVGRARAEQASHEELFAQRQQRALERWSKVLPDDQPATAKDSEIFVLGNVPQARVDEKLEELSEAVRQAKKLLKTPTREPLSKGGFTVFILNSRYDYSEFGRMNENRELPKDWLGHWKSDPLDVYGVLVTDQPLEPKQAKAVAQQVVVGGYLGSLTDVPMWFAEGVARNTVISTYRRGDPRVAEWQRTLPAALQKVKNAQSLLRNQLDEETAGLVGMALTNSMMDRSNRRRFDKLLSLLREGQSFTDATTFAFAPPEKLIQSWISK